MQDFVMLGTAQHARCLYLCRSVLLWNPCLLAWWGNWTQCGLLCVSVRCSMGRVSFLSLSSGGVCGWCLFV